MTNDAKPLTLYEKETLFFQDENLMDKIVRHVSNGGSVIDLAEMHGVRYCDVMLFIRSDKAMAARYEQALSDRKEWAKEAILRELKRTSLADIRKLYDANGNLLPIHEWPDDAAAGVTQVEVFEEFEGQGQERIKVGEVRKVKLVDKLKALELKGKAQALFIEKQQHNHVVSLKDLVLASYKDEPEESQT